MTNTGTRSIHVNSAVLSWKKRTKDEINVPIALSTFRDKEKKEVTGRYPSTTKQKFGEREVEVPEYSGDTLHQIAKVYFNN